MFSFFLLLFLLDHLNTLRKQLSEYLCLGICKNKRNIYLNKILFLHQVILSKEYNQTFYGEFMNVILRFNLLTRCPRFQSFK